MVLKLRGRMVKAYCQMSVIPAKTFLDATGEAFWGGSIHQFASPSHTFTLTFSRIRVIFSKCLVVVDVNDITFASYDPPAVSGVYTKRISCEFDFQKFEVSKLKLF